VSIEAITAIAAPSGVTGLTGTTGMTGPAGLTGTNGGPAAATSGDFASTLSASLENLQGMQTKTDNLAVQAATGQLTDVHDYIIAATEANLATQLAVAVRNKALDAFNEIMRMQA
jgi:flagellar hook-basal body complex protein FliE